MSMFKLESYITPLLMGYIDKYVKLKPDDFQLSLWGGDAVLGKLDLRLDVIERATQLPIVFKSGFIHELRIHVPWTRLYSEPVVITVNTIECIVKLRDSSSESDSSSVHTRSESVSASVNRPAKPVVEGAEDLPPGYLQSLLNKILHNVNIVVNNLILKFFEDDIVLSLNIKSAECYSVGGDWKRSFVELALPELALRRILDFHDLTLCLDRRNASGRIEMYQDPILYRCSLTCRFYMRYENLSAKLPFVTKLNIMCERLDMSLTDMQLPMFCRLLELFMALYYGTLELPKASVMNSDSMDRSDNTNAVVAVEPVGAESATGDDADSSEQQQGWVSWAWSFVPQIASPTEAESSDARKMAKKIEITILDIGTYIMRASIIFKLGQSMRDSGHFSATKMSFIPLMELDMAGIGIETTMRGETYFDVHFGISSVALRMSELEASAKGVTKDGFIFFELGLENPAGLDDNTLASCMKGSLFDDESAENKGTPTIYIFDELKHADTYNESYALSRYGAFWMDYMFTAEEVARIEEEADKGSSTDGFKKIFENLDLKEKSVMTFLFGSATVNVSSFAFDCVSKFLECMYKHEYEPYSKPRPVDVNQSRRPPTTEELSKLEEHTSTRSTYVNFVNVSICVQAACLPKGDVTKMFSIANRSSKKKPKSSDTVVGGAFKPTWLPAVLVCAERVELQTCAPMYAKAMAKYCSLLAAPSEHITYHCHSHLSLKLFGLEASLTSVNPAFEKYSIVHPFTVAYLSKSLLFPQYWKNPLQPRTEHSLELPSLTIETSKAELLYAVYIASSWMQTVPCTNKFMSLSLMNDVLTKTTDAHARSKPRQSTLQLMLRDLTITYCDAETARATKGTFGGINVAIMSLENGIESSTTILHAPVDTQDFITGELFTPTGNCSPAVQDHLLEFSLQTSKTSNIQAPSVLFLDIAGILFCFDPALIDWLMYAPSQCPASSEGLMLDQQNSVCNHILIAVDAELAQATVPLRDTTSKGSCSETTGTTAALTSNPVSSCPQLQVQSPVAKLEEEDLKERKDDTRVSGWGHLLGGIYPFIKIMQIQVNVKNWVCFLPVKPLRLSGSGANLLVVLRDSFVTRQLVDVLVICSPEFSIVSSGHKRAEVIREIPIKTLEYSIASDKLPWSVTLDNFSAYTVHRSDTVHHLLKPSSLCATVAVTTKYRLPAADSLLLLGLCIHGDMQSVEVDLVAQQIRLIYELVAKLAWATSRVYESSQAVFELFLPDHPDPVDRVPSETAEILVPNPVSFGPRTASSSFPESPNPYPVTGTITSESISLEAACNGEDIDSGSIELSLWMQWTLMKFTANIYCENKVSHVPVVRVTADLEDITTSLDVHSVYCKVKSKVGAVCVNHYVRSGEAWQPGSHESIILSCSETLTRSTTMFCQRAWRHHSTMHRTSSGSSYLGSDGQQNSDAGNHGFLNIVFTRALRTCARRRLRSTLYDTDRYASSASSDGSCLNEICLHVQPCDIVFNGPVLASLFEVFVSLDADSSSQLSMKSKSSGSSSNSQPFMTSGTLPLLYVDATGIRLFIPCTSSDDLNEGSEIGSRFSSANKADVCVVQFGTLTIVPQAVNPLPRLVVNKDLYARALQTGTTNQPGSDFEDRQYQIDLRGFSLSTGCWAQLVSRTDSMEMFDTKTANQNPALAWNMLRKVRETEEVRLVPVVTCFDLRTIFAPAIVFSPKSGFSSLVCGHSVELNATSDLEFFISVDQLRLFRDVFESNIQAILETIAAKPSSATITRVNTNVSAAEVTLLDSGIESESATAVSWNLPGSGAVTKDKPESSWNWLDSVTFDVLLTAGRISLMLYTQETELQSCSDVALSTTASDAVQVSQPADVAQEPNQRLIPLLHTTFSQPHSFVVCHDSNHKVELSCYDMTVRGPQMSVDHWMTPIEDQKLVPEPSDYPIHWIETRPGKVDAKTGIPACLYSLKIDDYLSQSAKIALDIGRPINILVSVAKLEHALMVLGKIQTAVTLAPIHTISTETLVSQSSLMDNSSMKDRLDDQPTCTYLARLGWRHCMLLHTSQIVITADVAENYKTASVKLAIAEIDADLGFALDGPVPCASSGVTLHDVLLQTSWNGQSTTLLGPLSPVASCRAQWKRHSGSSNLPVLVVVLTCNTVPVYFGQESVLAVELMTKCVQQLLMQNGLSSSPSSSSSVHIDNVDMLKKNDMVSMVNQTEDDLRAGMFEFVTDTKVDNLPLAGEIVFNSGDNGSCASMTWRYNEWRVITKLEIMPVPFKLTAEYNEIDTSLQVPCILQYSKDPEHQSFENYAEFYLSENIASEVLLSEVDSGVGGSVVAADVWRVLILNRLMTTDSDGQRIICHDGTSSSGDEEAVPIVLPMTLAASLRVNSAFARHLIPVCQFSITCDSLQIGLLNQPDRHKKAFPSVHPFKLVEKRSQHSVLTLSLNSGCLLTDILGCGSCSKLHTCASFVASCDFVEFGSLTMRRVFESWPVSSKICWQLGSRPKLEVDAEFGKLEFSIGQSLLHSINGVIHTWKNMHDSKSERVIMEYYMICNNTQQALNFGQAETEECISLKCREACPYSWRSQKSTQLMQIVPEGMSLSLCSPIDINKKGVVSVALVDMKGVRKVLIVRIQQLTNSQKQIIISGQLTVANMLSRKLQLKLMTTNPNAELITDLIEMDALSYIVDQSCTKGFKVSLNLTNPVWSSEVSIFTLKTAIGHLVKVPLGDKSDSVHVWCHVYNQQHKDAVEILVIFLPLFVVKVQLPSALLMKVDTPRLRTSVNLELAGRGLEKQLFLPGGDVTHTITFKLGPNMAASSPVVSLSSDTIQQVGRENLASGDLMEVLASMKNNAIGVDWPYNEFETPSIPSPSRVLSNSDISLPYDSLHGSVGLPRRPSVCDADQPNIDLKVSLIQHWHGLNTLLIDVAPYWLVVNECDVDLTIGETNGRKIKVPAGKTSAPPVFNEEEFSIGIQLSGQLHFSDVVRMCNQDAVESPYRSTNENLLFIDGHIQLDIPVKAEGVTIQMCCLSIHSTYQHQMRIVTIRERFNFINRTTFDLDVYCACIPLSLDKVAMLEKAHTLVRLRPGSSNSASMHAVLLWNVLHPRGTHTHATAASSETDESCTYVQYICLKMHNSASKTIDVFTSRSRDERSDAESPGISDSLSDSYVAGWSCPVRLRMSPNGVRHNVAVPCSVESSLETGFFSILAQMDSAVLYLTLVEDHHPAITLHNHCDVMFYYGQKASDVAGYQGVTVQEEVELVSDLPRLAPHSSVCYTPPFINTKFPESGVLLPKVHLAGAVSNGATLWSYGIDLALEHGSFINIPEVYDVKVSSVKVGYTIHVNIEQVSRAEISAKEIRSRIKSPAKSESTAKVPDSVTAVTPMNTSQRSVEIIRSRKSSAVRSSSSREHCMQSRDSTCMLLSVNCMCNQFSFVLIDELSSAGTVLEVISATLENMTLSCHTKLDVIRSSFGQIQHVHHVEIGIGDLQLDNLLYGRGSYDFSVVLGRQSERRPDEDVGMSKWRVGKRIEHLSGHCLISCSVDIVMSNITTVQTVRLVLKPINLCIEDVFIIDILKVIDAMVPTVSAGARKAGVARKCPHKVSERASVLSSPIRLQRLCIETIDMKVSVHASLKLYIASDNAPLSLGLFEQTNICTTSEEFLRMLTMHYVSCALYRAGLLVGSLEILGNPTGFLRNVGNGVADMFRMPYQGLTKGPGAFLAGVTRGSSSLLWHLSTGTLTSITDFASSVSRNMERLSLDTDHVMRNEKMRRNKPCRLSEGLRNGLSGFGLSVLGAIAGIADQPLQSLTRVDDPGSPTSSGSVATGFMSGLGRGLVGAVTKPIGGAAEFVSQTSMGILHQVGLGNVRQPKRIAVDRLLNDFDSSANKFKEKLLRMLPDAEVLTLVLGWQLSGSRSSASSPTRPRCALVLTREVLCVIDVDEDVLLRTFTVADVECHREVDDAVADADIADTLVIGVSSRRRSATYLEIDQQTNQDRCAEFVGSVARSAAGSDSSCTVDCRVIEYTFLIPHRTDCFLSYFRIVKQVALGNGFIV